MERTVFHDEPKYGHARNQPRVFLLLQGPMGSFFKKLASGLRASGYQTLRVNFNGGDRLHFSSRYAIDFTGPIEAWPDAVEALALKHGITDLIVYNDCRPLHRSAIERLKPLGITVHVYEEGYFRPGWITLEEGGVNGFSSLPRDARFYRSRNSENINPTMSCTVSFGPSHGKMIRHTISYYIASAMLQMHYRHYRTHRQRTYQKEGLAWLVRMVENYLKIRLLRQRKLKLINENRPYFLVLLQLLGDSQITHHSGYNDMYEFLDEILQDFAKNAPIDTCIAVKNHPLDNGLSRYGSFLRQKARSLGLGDRLVFIDGGRLPPLLRNAHGVVTVNSTGGLSAIHHELPTKTMGNAIYNIPGLTSQQSLSEFWNQPNAPDPELFRVFRDYVINHAQLHGNYYTKRGLRCAVNCSIARLTDISFLPLQKAAS